MKFQRTSLILVFLALALGGFVYYYEFRNQPQTEAKSDSKPVFNFKEADVASFTVKTSKQPTVTFEKVPGAVPVWMMRKPENTQADDGAVAFLLNLLTTGRSDRTLSIPSNRKSEFGLDQPSATVEVKLANQQTHQFVLGKPNFNRNFVYALADPPADTNQALAVLLVPIDFQNAVDRPLNEWKKAKPKKDAKITPSPSSSGSPNPSTSPSSSSPSSSPSPSSPSSSPSSPSTSPSPSSSSPSPSPSPSPKISPQ